MSILGLPVASTGITLNEVPKEIAVYFELANCTNGCHGCHSKHLQQEVPQMDLKTLKDTSKKAIDQGATAIVLMGGTTNGLKEDTLIHIIDELSTIADVCLYSGSDDTARDLKLLEESNLRWLKTGAYKEALGGLQDPKTNQKFYEKEPVYKYDLKDSLVHLEYTIKDKTYLFRRRSNHEKNSL